MHLFALSDMEFYEKKLKFWSDVYGFKMSTMKQIVLKDAQIDTFKSDDVVSDVFKFKEIDCSTCTLKDINKFEAKFSLKINKDCELTGIGSSFDTFFNHPSLKEKVSFFFSSSTS
jgi:protein arginine N-methyltransferase 3